MTTQEAFDQLNAALKPLRDEMRRILTPVLDALNRVAIWLGL
jgi:hypothetical protein